MKINMDKALQDTFIQHRETGYHHTSYDEEMYQYELLKQGDPEAVEQSRIAFQNADASLLSKDTLRGWKYMFVASTTLCCRYAMDGGLDSETSYNLSDLYIRQADLCTTVQDIFSIHEAMVTEYTNRLRELNKTSYTRSVLRVFDYVDYHLHDEISLSILANYAGVTPNHLSAVFHHETGMTISRYIRVRRIEAAKAFLQYYDYSILEIAEYLRFSSASHFSRVFHDETSETPSAYRKNHFRKWKEPDDGD